MRISLCLLLVLFAGALFTSTGCYEVADLVKSVGADVDTPDTPGTSTADRDSEIAYGPFPPDDTDTGSNGEPDDDDDDTDSNGTTDPTLEPLPDGAEVETLASGLGVYDFEVGSGDQPQSLADDVRVDYAGYIEATGRQFDSGEDVPFNLSRVVAGFGEGILGMKEGGRRRIIIPPDLGYGAGGNAGAGIGGTDVIVFDVTLLAVE